MNYFQYHGSSIWDKRREILEKATFCDENNRKVFRHEKRRNDFIGHEEIKSWKFIYKGKLHYFLTDFYGQISSFFELKMSEKECLENNCGCFYTYAVKQECENHR